MATVQIAISNPTASDITVNAKTAKAMTVTKLGLDDTTNEAEQFLAGGCALVSVSAQADVGKRLQAAFRLYRLQHQVI